MRRGREKEREEEREGEREGGREMPRRLLDQARLGRTPTWAWPEFFFFSLGSSFGPKICGNARPEQA